MTFARYYSKKSNKDFSDGDPYTPTGMRVSKIPKKFHDMITEWKDLQNELYRHGKKGVKAYNMEDALNKLILDGADAMAEDLKALRRAQKQLAKTEEAVAAEATETE